jgi:hypothetical protein
MAMDPLQLDVVKIVSDIQSLESFASRFPTLESVDIDAAAASLSFLMLPVL